MIVFLKSVTYSSMNQVCSFFSLPYLILLVNFVLSFHLLMKGLAGFCFFLSLVILIWLFTYKWVCKCSISYFLGREIAGLSDKFRFNFFSFNVSIPSYIPTIPHPCQNFKKYGYSCFQVRISVLYIWWNGCLSLFLSTQLFFFFFKQHWNYI